MARLTDPERLDPYCEALRNWNCDGIQYRPLADAWVRRNLPKLTILGLNKLLHDYVILRNGVIDEVVETREGWKDEADYHHDLRLPYGGRLLYVESVLIWSPFRPKVDPFIEVVNVHWA